MEWLKRIFAAREPEPPAGDPDRVRQVEAVLDDLRPLLALDGGAVRLVAVEGDAIVLAFDGACRSCASIGTTLTAAVEPELRRRLPWIRSVRAAAA